MYGNVEAFNDADDEGKAALGAKHGAFAELLKQRGNWVGGLGFEATTVRNVDGGSTMTPGAHSEGIDQLGGFYLVETDDLDEALELAKQVPAPTVEVRAVADQ